MLRLSRELRLSHVLDADWWMLNPVSLALWRHGTAYVGMRGVVVEVQLSATPPKQTWLYPF